MDLSASKASFAENDGVNIGSPPNAVFRIIFEDEGS